MEPNLFMFTVRLKKWVSKIFDEIFGNFGPFPVIQPLHSQLLEAPKDGNSRSRSISGVSMRPIVSPGSRF